MTLLGASTAQAAPLYLKFQAVENLLNRAASVDLANPYYVLSIDDKKPASIEYSDGSSRILQDYPAAHFFRVDNVDANQIRSQAPDDYYSHLGSLYQDGSYKQDAWGTGPTYGTYWYLALVSFQLFGWNDRVSIDGRFGSMLPGVDEASLSLPAMWTIYDEGARADGSPFGQLYRANLLSISTSNPLANAAPEPASAALVVVAVAAAGVATRRRNQPVATA